jgi:hypothetical protein
VCEPLCLCMCVLPPPQISRKGVESENTAVPRQWLCKHILAATKTYATTEELLGAVFSMRYVSVSNTQYMYMVKRSRVEAGLNTSTLRVVGGDENGTQCLGV